MAVVAALGVMSVSAFATTVGYISKTIAPGEQQLFANTFITSASAADVGTTSGVVAGTSGSSIDCFQPNGTDAASFIDFVSAGATPYYLKITGGDAVGTIYRITSVTDGDTLVLSPRPLADAIGTALPDANVDSTDTYEIVQGYTISEFFALSSGSIYSGGSFANSDQIYVINQGTFQGFWFNGTNWRPSGLGGNQDDFVIEPWGGVFYVRSGSATGDVVVTTSGTVATGVAKIDLPTSGQAIISLSFPSDITLADTGIGGVSTSMVSGGTFATSDKLYVVNDGTFQGFWYNGTNWRPAGLGGNQDTFVIQAGTPIFIVRVGTSSAQEITVNSPL